MTKSDRMGREEEAMSARFSGRASESGLFDNRNRTVPWMNRTLYRLYNAEVQRILGREKLSIAHWYYLRVLAQRGDVNQLELSKQMGIASTTVVPAIDSMEKRGLLKRSRDTKDRRKYCLSLTESGRSMVEKLLPEIMDMLSASFEGLSQDDMLTFSKGLLQIGQNLMGMTDGSLAG